MTYALPLDPAADSARLHAAMAKWRRRSHLIRFFRRALPATMALVLLGLLGWVAAQTILREPEKDASVSIRMINPRFHGQDERGRAFVLAAGVASRDANAFHRVLLQKPALRLESQGGAKPLRVRARSGVYDERTQVIVLEGAVHVEDPSGWIFDTERAVVDTNRDVISGDKPLKGVGPMGHIAANSYVIYNQGERVIFRGGVRTTLAPAPK